ncbi:MAG TPA: PQQ-binding-like beta-propeller repeat protein, partial [Gammaproteobacteria bacterium]|nr:PQQ-binding-like beta-propeller repeat protein [Gammaproteobacteria bacterium]
TWKGSKWWKYGGGGTVWDSMAYDPELDLLYIGTGNASPWNYKIRSPGGGDNLFVSSIVALKPDTGEYVWHYQTTPGDNWDYTATQHIILADITINGESRKVLMQAPKNGFFYVIDRINGKLLSAEKYVQATWASRIDLETGRPVKTELGDYDEAKILIFPGALGGHNWMPMSYNPETGLVYIPAQELYMPMKKDDDYEYDQKGWNTAGDLTVMAPPKNLLQLMLLAKSVRGRLSAWDPVQQKEVWNQYLTLPWNGGTLSTNGNLVFQGTSDGELIAYNAKTGEKKWSKDLKTGIIAAPITYSIDGKQYVTVVAGYGGVFALQAGLPPKYSGGPINARIVTFALDGDVLLPERPASREMPKPPSPIEDQTSIARGEDLYHWECHMCHGAGAVGGGVLADLRYMSEGTHKKFNAITLGGLYTEKGMVGFASRLSEQDAKDIHAYLIQRANETYLFETINSALK